MDQICDFNKYTGCGACSGGCPVSCIKMVPCKKDLGLIHPVIDNSICINCDLCKKICPVNFPITLEEPKVAIASYILNDEECDNSSSGGMAYLF